MSNKKKVVHSQGRKIIYNVFQFIKEQKEPLKLTTPLYEAVATATGVGISTVKRICKEAKRKPKGSKFESPRKTIKKNQFKSTVDQLDEVIIRTVIHRYTSIHKRRPTMAAVFQAVKEDGVNFIGKLCSFRSLIHKMGFRWKRTQDNRKALTEKLDIHLKRTAFLRKLKLYKQERRNIVYTDEIFT